MQNFEIIARAVIIQNNKLLVCKRKDRDYYFLPGGHVEFGEKAEDALRREIKEELGMALRSMQFIGALENVFREDGAVHHEFNIIFSAIIFAAGIESCEDHICFSWLDTSDLTAQNLVPEALKTAIAQWFRDKTPFWASQAE